MRFKCENCGFEFECVEKDYPITCKCGVRTTLDENKNPVLRYFDAVKNWRAKGSPTRTEAEIATILQICDSCEFFKNGICRHKKCGCTLTTNLGGRLISRIAVATAKMFGIKPAMFEKVRMATEHCPKSLW